MPFQEYHFDRAFLLNIINGPKGELDQSNSQGQEPGYGSVNISTNGKTIQNSKLQLLQCSQATKVIVVLIVSF